MKPIIFELEHSLTVLLVSSIILCLGLPFPMHLLAPAFFAGREHAQAEYRWIEKFGQGKRANMPEWGGFDPRVWDTHSLWWNLSLPFLVGLAFVAAAQL